MQRQALINDTLKKLEKLPDNKIIEVNNFIGFVLSRIDDKLLNEAIKQLTSDSKSFKYLKDEEDLYSVNDLKEKYK